MFKKGDKVTLVIGRCKFDRAVSGVEGGLVSLEGSKVKFCAETGEGVDTRVDKHIELS